jgi:hypothetical protein
MRVDFTDTIRPGLILPPNFACLKKGYLKHLTDFAQSAIPQSLPGFLLLGKRLRTAAKNPSFQHPCRNDAIRWDSLRIGGLLLVHGRYFIPKY